MDRRSFIKLTAITGASATLASCGSPENQVIRRFVPEEELTPGIAEWRPGVCPLCSSGCGLKVRVMDADVDVTRDGQKGIARTGVAKKFEGDPANPINQGALCARGQAAIQVTYHPDRIVQPLKRSGTRGDGQFTAITWDAAIGELVTRLDAAAAAPASLAAITGGRRSHRQQLMDRVLTGFGAAPAVTYELFGNDVLRKANAMSFGVEQLPTFDFRNARSVISFGADFLGTWGSVVSQSMGYGHMRRGRPGIRGSFIQVESRMTTTGASADEWVGITPGTEGVLALGIAHVILEHKLRPDNPGRATALIAGWSGGLSEYEPANVEKITGVRPERVERIAHDLIEQSPAVALVAGPPLAHTNALFSALAVNALNQLLGAVGQPGGLSFMPQLNPPAAPSAAKSNQPATGARQPLDKFAAAVLGGSQTVNVLLLDGANPVYAAPKAWKVSEALAKVPFIVSFGSFIDDTSVMADLILPDHSFLESWTEALPESGALSAAVMVAPAAMKPLFGTKATPDVLFEVAGKLQKPIALPWASFDEMIKASFDRIGEDAWTEAQRNGGWWGPLPQKSSTTGRAVAAPGSDAVKAEAGAVPVSYVPPTFNGDAAQYPYQFLPYASLQFNDGSASHLPWLQELPDPTTSGMWSSWVELNPTTAAALGVSLGDIVEVTSSAGTLRSPAFINPALAPELIAMPVGQGHTNFTRYASGRGQNPVEILAPVNEASTGALAWAATRVKVARVGDPDGKLIMFSAGGELREKPHEGRTR